MLISRPEAPATVEYVVQRVYRSCEDRSIPKQSGTRRRRIMRQKRKSAKQKDPGSTLERQNYWKKKWLCISFALYRLTHSSMKRLHPNLDDQFDDIAWSCNVVDYKYRYLYLQGLPVENSATISSDFVLLM